MRVTLDWDSEQDRQQHMETVKAAAESNGQPWELRRSSSGSGYHMIAFDAVNDTASGWRALTGTVGEPVEDCLRGRWGDDPKRIKLDRKRWNMGSPFLQVLYRRKYMGRFDFPPYQTGETARVVDGVKEAPESRQIKEDGRLMYHKISRVLTEVYGSQQALAEKMGVSRSTVSRWNREKTGISDANRSGLRRKARSQGVGHFVDTDDGGISADEHGIGVRYVDEEQQRRTLVEYMDAPWDTDIGGDDREYRLIQVETGSFNPNHTDMQLRQTHEHAAEKVQEMFSATLPNSGVSLDLDRTVRNPSEDPVRNSNSVHYEQEYLDNNERDVYLGNLPNPGRVSGDPANHIITEVLVWTTDMSEVDYHLILVDDGDQWADHTVLTETTGKGWW